VLCHSCKELLAHPNTLEKYAHHSKDCLLWPFGFYERLCLLGLFHHPSLQSLFSSYQIQVITDETAEKKVSILSLFDSLELVFSPLPWFAHVITRSISLPPYFLVSERASSFLCTAITSGRMKRMCEKLELRWKNSDIGWGLFAREAFEAGEILGVYSGEVKSLSYFSKKADLTYTAELVRTFPWSRPLVVDAKKVGSLMRFINHQDEPNLFVEYVRLCSLPFLLVASMKAIEPGEELFLSYGKDFWKRRKMAPK